MSSSATADTRTAVEPVTGYRTSPDQETTGWPPGVPYIIGNEACERFSFYGMRAILFVHLSSLYLLAGYESKLAADSATATVHLFFAGVYALPMIGAILADRLLGKYQTILCLSLVYCAGHAVLAFAEHTLTGMYLGLGLIAMGAGGIKPCVSANVGDQFGKGNWFRVRTIFQAFYFSVNFGSFFATLLIPWVRDSSPLPTELRTKVAFGIPGILMFTATVLFWMGRRKFVHVPPRPGGKVGLIDTLCCTALFLCLGHFFFTGKFDWWVKLLASGAFLALGLWLFAVRQRLAPDDGFLAIMVYTLRRLFMPERAETDSASTSEAGSSLARSRFWGPAVARFGQEATEGPVAVLKVVSVFFLVSVFWALFDQHSSSWIRQAAMMDLHWLWGDEPLKPSQIPALNPLMVMFLIPIMNLVYSAVDRCGIKTTPLRRITVGMIITSLSFVAVALIQTRIDAEGEGKVWFAWQIIPYVLLTIGEVMVSITGLEFAYTQAPKRMKSTVMGFWLMATSLGNVLVAFLAGFEKLALVDFFWVFAGLMAGAGVLFGLRACFYVPRDYTQG